MWGLLRTQHQQHHNQACIVFRCIASLELERKQEGSEEGRGTGRKEVREGGREGRRKEGGRE